MPFPQSAMVLQGDRSPSPELRSRSVSKASVPETKTRNVTSPSKGTTSKPGTESSNRFLFDKVMLSSCIFCVCPLTPFDGQEKGFQGNYSAMLNDTFAWWDTDTPRRLALLVIIQCGAHLVAHPFELAYIHLLGVLHVVGICFRIFAVYFHLYSEYHLHHEPRASATSVHMIASCAMSLPLSWHLITCMADPHPAAQHISPLHQSLSCCTAQTNQRRA